MKRPSTKKGASKSAKPETSVSSPRAVRKKTSAVRSPAAKPKTPKTKTRTVPSRARRPVAAKTEPTPPEALKLESAPFTPVQAAVSPKLRPEAEQVPFRLPVPSILLEGDAPVTLGKADSGEKFGLKTVPAFQQIFTEPAETPASCGGRLHIIARDPRCLFVSWDFTDDQQRCYNSLSADKHLILRAHYDSLSSDVATEIHLHPQTRHWFLHVPHAGTRYVVEIGYYLPDGAWITARSSEPVSTPPDRPSEDHTIRFAYAPLVPLVSPVYPEPLPERITAPEPSDSGWRRDTVETPAFTELRTVPPIDYPQWTAAQEVALSELIGDLVRREQVSGSFEILELLQQQVQRQKAPIEQAPSSVSIMPAEKEQLPSSPAGERLPPRKGFWFNINAELIIYGATEPDARVTIGGRAIKLRADGSFSCRFALPDGNYELPAAATSADESETRRAELRFSRQTAYSGEVGAHPQDSALRAPAPDNIP